MRYCSVPAMMNDLVIKIEQETLQQNTYVCGFVGDERRKWGNVGLLAMSNANVHRQMHRR